MYFKMKQFLMSLFILINFHIVLSQNNSFCFVYKMNEKIPIYNSSEDSIPSYFLYQDSLKENYYSLQILDKIDDRFLVNVFEYNDLKCNGWIEKKYCCVWCWLMSSNNIYLFLEPNIYSSHIEIFEDDLMQNQDGIVANIIDFDKKSKWVKILLTVKEKTYIGWTLNYCNNIYGSCEGERATPPSHVYGFIKREK